MNMARTARAAGDSGICHVMLRGSPTKDIRRRRVMLTENRPNGIKIREQCPKKSRIKMQEVGEGKLKTGKPPKKSIANKPAGKQ